MTADKSKDSVKTSLHESTLTTMAAVQTIPPKGKLLHRRHSCPPGKLLNSSSLKLDGKIGKFVKIKTSSNQKSSSRNADSNVTLHYPTPKLNYELFHIDTGNSANRRLTLAQLHTKQAEALAVNTNKTKDNKADDSSVQTASKNVRFGRDDSPTLPDSKFLDRRRNSSPSYLSEKKNQKEKQGAERNEAEIIEPELFRSRHSSISSGLDKMAATFRASGAAMIRAGTAGKRRGSLSESVDREMRSLYRNTIEDRRLQHAMTSLDKQSLVGSLEHRNKQMEVYNHHLKTSKRSPSADQWLDLRRSYTSTLQEHGRMDITRRYSRRARHFRAPKHLQDTVSKIRSYAMFEAGLVSTGEISRDDNYDDVAEKMMTMSVSESSRSSPYKDLAIRRHSLYTGNDDVNDNIGQEVASARDIGAWKDANRRMTMADIQSIKEILEFRALHVSRAYIDHGMNESNLEDDDKDCSDEFDIEDESDVKKKKTTTKTRERFTPSNNKNNDDKDKELRDHQTKNRFTGKEEERDDVEARKDNVFDDLDVQSSSDDDDEDDDSDFEKHLSFSFHLSTKR